MLPRLDSIREMRTRIGVTQRRLADMAGVSTSMINQIESGRTKPGYETASRIFDSLVTLEGKSSSHTAGDFCSTELVRLAPADTLRDAITHMQAFSISQVPVFDGESPVGIVTEDGIVRHIADGERSGAAPDSVPIASAMDPAPSHSRLRDAGERARPAAAVHKVHTRLAQGAHRRGSSRPRTRYE